MTDKTPRINIPADIKKYVFDRNGYQCQSCYIIDFSAKSLQVDHIIPLAQGGANDFSNFQTLCGKCNRTKSSKIDLRFRRLYSD